MAGTDELIQINPFIIDEDFFVQCLESGCRHHNLRRTFGGNAFYEVQGQVENSIAATAELRAPRVARVQFCTCQISPVIVRKEPNVGTCTQFTENKT